MKNKIIALISLIIAILAISFLSFKAGIRHAIEDSRIYLDGSIVSIDLDGQVYEHHID